MKQKNGVFIGRKWDNRYKKSTSKRSTENPYVLYRLDGKNRKANTIIKNIEKDNSPEKIHKYIKKITESGESYQGIRLNRLKKGNIILKSKDNLYGIYREDETNSLYLLMFLKYDDIKGGLRNIKKGL